MYGETLSIDTAGQGLYDITRSVDELVSRSGIREGLCNVFIRHTSASLVLSENADPSARHDLAAFFTRIAPELDPHYTHTSEGPDDMPSHIRSALTHTSETIPVEHGRLALGTWQGLFLFEHRSRPHRRQLMVKVLGE